MNYQLQLTEWGWFWCAHCKRDFPKGWSDAEARTEHDKDFPGKSMATAVIICDDCYKEINAWFEQRPWLETRFTKRSMMETNNNERTQ